ncbi:MAG: hypothetical protein AAGG75_01540 [Bacteroidota bacterium]
MRLIINLVLVVLIFGLVYVLYGSISEPIEFKAEKDKRKSAVVDRLIAVRQAQELYRDVTGEFANDFDSLKYVIRTGKVMIIKPSQDPDDPGNADAIIYDTLYEDAMVRAQTLELNLDSLEYIPFSNGKTFQIKADTLTYQKTLVNVVEVSTVWKEFMGPYADIRFSRYDNGYDPNAILKFGNMNAPNTSGNWER